MLLSLLHKCYISWSTHTVYAMLLHKQNSSFVFTNSKYTVKILGGLQGKVYQKEVRVKFKLS